MREGSFMSMYKLSIGEDLNAPEQMRRASLWIESIFFKVACGAHP